MNDQRKRLEANQTSGTEPLYIFMRDPAEPIAA